MDANIEEAKGRLGKGAVMAFTWGDCGDSGWFSGEGPAAEPQGGMVHCKKCAHCTPQT